MDPNEQEDIIHSPKDVDYSKMSEVERQAQFRRKRQEYIAEKEARKKQVMRIKREQFGSSSSDQSDDDAAGSRSSGSSGIKKQQKLQPKAQNRVQVTSNRLEVQTKLTQQTSPIKKKSQSLQKIGVNLFSKKGNEWIKDVLVIGDKTIIIQNITEQIKRISKIKIISQLVLGSPFKIKINFGEDQEIIFSVSTNQQKLGLPSHYYTFAKLIQMKLTQSRIKLRDNQIQKIPGVPESIIAGSFIYGKIYKKSQVLGNWQQRFILINKEGIFSYKKFNQKHSMHIAAGSINQMWTRFQVQDNLLIIKIWHSGKKTQFGFPLNDCLSNGSWLYNFYLMMAKAR